MVINLEAKMVDLLSSYHSMQQIHFVNEVSKVVGFMSQLLKNLFKRNNCFANPSSQIVLMSLSSGQPSKQCVFLYFAHCLD